MAAKPEGSGRMIRVESIWLACGVSDLRAGIDTLLARVVRGFEGGAQMNTAYAGGAAVLMSLIESAKLNCHDAWAYLKDILTKLPTWPNSQSAKLLLYRWAAPGKG